MWLIAWAMIIVAAAFLRPRVLPGRTRPPASMFAPSREPDLSSALVWKMFLTAFRQCVRESSLPCSHTEARIKKLSTEPAHGLDRPDPRMKRGA